MRDRSKQKYFALWAQSKIDSEDQHELDERAWRINMFGGKPYVVGTDRINRRVVRLYLHRVIMNAPPGVQVDHRNGDSLDNRRCNLRICTKVENDRNRKHRMGGLSKYKGVCWNKQKRKWQARIKSTQERFYLGYFDDEEGAAFAYDVAARILFGEFAWLNFQEAA